MRLWGMESLGSESGGRRRKRMNCWPPWRLTCFPPSRRLLLLLFLLLFLPSLAQGHNTQIKPTPSHSPVQTAYKSISEQFPSRLPSHFAHSFFPFHCHIFQKARLIDSPLSLFLNGAASDPLAPPKSPSWPFVSLFPRASKAYFLFRQRLTSRVRDPTQPISSLGNSGCTGHHSISGQCRGTPVPSLSTPPRNVRHK